MPILVLSSLYVLAICFIEEVSEDEAKLILSIVAAPKNISIRRPDDPLISPDIPCINPVQLQLLTSVHLLNYRLMIAVLSLSSGDLIRDLSSLSEITWISVLVHVEAHSPVCNSCSVFTYGILTSRCSLGQIESLVFPLFNQGFAFRLHGSWEGIHYCQHFLS